MKISFEKIRTTKLTKNEKLKAEFCIILISAFASESDRSQMK